MSAKFISLILGASMAITSLTAAPARAGDKDLARAVAAIAGIALIGAAVSNSSNRKSDYVSSRGYGNNRYYGHQPRRVHQNVQRHGQYRRQAVASRAYQKGYNDHRAQVRDHRAQVRDHRTQKGHARRGYGYGH